MRRMVVEESTHYRRKTGIIIAEIDLTGGSSFIAPRKKPMQVQALLEKAVASLAVTPVCPRCRKTIPSEDVNVLNDIAYCRACNLSHHLSTLTSGVVLDPDIDLSRPPAGTWFRRDSVSATIGATHRAPGQAFGLLLFCLFWNGIVSVFVLLATASTLQHIGIGVPSWFPSPTSHGKMIPVGMTIFLWLFLTPFIGIGLGMLTVFLSCLAGRTELRIEGKQAVLFTGIGPVGFRKRFLASEVQDVRIEQKRWQTSEGNSRQNMQIVMDLASGKAVKFGSMLTNERRGFVAAAAQKVLIKR